MGVTFPSTAPAHTHAGETLGEDGDGIVKIFYAEQGSTPAAPDASTHVQAIVDDGKTIEHQWRTSGSTNIVDTASS